jgi:hypothetical protein
MVVLGLVLIALAVAAVAVFVVQNRTDFVTVHALGQTWSGHLYWLVVAGLIIAAVALLGLMLVRAGGAHAWRVRRDRRTLAQERKSLAVENDRLSQQLEAERETVVREPVVREPVVREPMAPVATPIDSGRPL